MIQIRTRSAVPRRQPSPELDRGDDPRLVRGDLPPTSAIRPHEILDGEQKLRLLLEGASDHNLIVES
jgi:hypothetical protein